MRGWLAAAVLLVGCGDNGQVEETAPDAFVSHGEVIAAGQTGTVTTDSLSIPIETTTAGDFIAVSVYAPRSAYGHYHVVVGRELDTYLPAEDSVCDGWTILWAPFGFGAGMETGATSIDVHFDTPTTFQLDYVEARGLEPSFAGLRGGQPDQPAVPGQLYLGVAGTCGDFAANAPYAGGRLAYVIPDSLSFARVGWTPVVPEQDTTTFTVR